MLLRSALVITPPFLESFRPPISGAILCAIIKEEPDIVPTVWDANIELYNAVGKDKFFDMQLQFNGLQDLTEDSVNTLYNHFRSHSYNYHSFILISVFSKYEVASTRILLEVLKERDIRSTIILGGPGVEQNVDGGTVSFGKEMVDQGLATYYIVGEGEIALKKLLQGETSYPGINGIPPVQIEDIESLPMPDYSAYNLDNYDYVDPNNPDLFVYGSRGCVRNCSFCDVPFYWPKFRFRSGKSIADELQRNWEHYGVKHFFFTDSLVNGSLKSYREFHEEIAKRHVPKFHIAGYAIIRPKNQHPAELFDMMANTGTHFWSVGVEHGSDEMRLDMRKKFTNDDIDWHLENSERIQMQNHFLLMPTWVKETEKHHQEYLDIFPRWQNYVASNTIASVTMAPALAALQHTPLTTEHYDLEFENIGSLVMQEMLWKSKSNPDLDLRERYRRATAIWRQAIKYKWPLSEARRQLLDMKSIVQKTKDLGLF